MEKNTDKSETADSSPGVARFEMTEGEKKLREVITIHAVGSPGASRLGDAAEAEFVARVCRMDFRVCKPWGNIEPYDVVVGMGRGFWRVQVKGVGYYSSGKYTVKASGCQGRYSKEDTDFIAVHIVPEDIWYIVPIEALDSDHLYFNPRRKQRGKQPLAKYEKYREAWCLLACTDKARGWKDIPAVCRCKDLPQCAVCPRR